MAVEFAVISKCRNIVLNHFSQRYRSEKDDKYKEDDSMSDSILLRDGMAKAKELNMKEDYVDIARDLQVFNVFRNT
jgi:ribonuclease BN (tRNA processing enzyme)